MCAPIFWQLVAHRLSDAIALLSFNLCLLFVHWSRNTLSVLDYNELAVSRILNVFHIE